MTSSLNHKKNILSTETEQASDSASDIMQMLGSSDHKMKITIDIS